MPSEAPYKQWRRLLGKALDTVTLTGSIVVPVSLLSSLLDARQMNPKACSSPSALVISLYRSWSSTMTLGVNRSALNAVSRGEIRESVGGDRAPLSLTLVGFGFADAVVSHPSKIWSRLQSQCINGRYLVEKESPFTFHNMTRVCYRGLPLSLATSTLSLGLITLGADKIRETIQSHTSLSSTSSGLAASALAGTVATAVTLPIDAMRTKMVQCATRNTLDNKITMPSTLALMRGLLDDVRRRGANTTLKEVASFMFKKELPYSLARTVSVFMIINRVTELVTATPVTSRYPGFFDANDSGREASDSPKESSPRKPGR